MPKSLSDPAPAIAPPASPPSFGERLGLEFFARDALVVARDLLGTLLVHRLPDGEARAVRIVETEAYRGPTDRACHARVGLTKRTRTLYGPPGHAYVYLIYGMYDCFNVVCFGEGKGHAVLVRAGEPLSGIPKELRTDGPGRMTRALGITRAHDGFNLREGALFLVPRATSRRPTMTTTARVGVGYSGVYADKPWRFFDAASRHVSRPSPSQIGTGGVRAR
ncbi:DNA-3-methyladenine glycosylase [Pendulispora albinea]|uniref:Putative 3-methyladenine DNA glycosylase n=1 Tax=Pendulispora albinea TaxID=2741071 RepID=A0ABZ2M4C2_9BACT